MESRVAVSFECVSIPCDKKLFDRVHLKRKQSTSVPHFDSMLNTRNATNRGKTLIGGELMVRPLFSFATTLL